MTHNQRIAAFVALGNHLKNISEDTFQSLAESARLENPWFTEDNVRLSLNAIIQYTSHEKLAQWTSGYALEPKQYKTVAVVMAGNIPLVGFHDFLSVLISGHAVQLKLSSKDSKLINYIIKHLVWLEPAFEKLITIQDGRIENFDAVIATGSDNSSRYFNYYFKKYPHIIRQNRTSCAILTGNETVEQLQHLGVDIFSYFGLGCRNISKIFIPKEYDLTMLLPHWEKFNTIINHHKYCNNYDYQKSILLVNRIPFLDNGFLILQETEKLVSPISVLYYERYTSHDDLMNILKNHEQKTQCIVGNVEPAKVDFGNAQFPELWDYADQIDTLAFLAKL
jgi:hypothetical protein